MSRLDELIAELCPDGVPFRKIKEVYTRLKGTPITAGKMKEIENPDGEIKIFAGGKTVINAREEDIPNANITRVPAVLVQSRGVIDFIYYEEPFTFKNEMWAYTAENKTTVKYLYYILKNNTAHFRDAASGMGSLPQISLPVTEDFIIPVPPLEVQEEIVRILDTFTELTAELTVKLTTELTVRKKQYEYYHNYLMDFSKRTDISWCSVGDYFTFKNGINKGKEFFGEGNYIVNFTDVYNHRWLTKEMLKGRVKTEPRDLIAYDAKKGDLFFTRTSETKEDIGMVSTLLDDIEGCVFSGFVLRARPLSKNWLPKFCSYYFSSSEVRKEIVRYASFTTRALTSGPRLSKLKIPLISIEEQQYIVDILDNFNTLYNDITKELSAEIAARQKQYEYYRDKLLTFKELA